MAGDTYGEACSHYGIAAASGGGSVSGVMQEEREGRMTWIKNRTTNRGKRQIGAKAQQAGQIGMKIDKHESLRWNEGSKPKQMLTNLRCREGGGTTTSMLMAFDWRSGGWWG